MVAITFNRNLSSTPNNISLWLFVCIQHGWTLAPQQGNYLLCPQRAEELWLFCFLLLHLIILFHLLLLVDWSIDGISLQIWIFHDSSLNNCKLVKSPTTYASVSRQWVRHRKHSSRCKCAHVENYGCTALSIYKSSYQTPSRWVTMFPREQNNRNEKQLHCQSHQNLTIVPSISSSSYPLGKVWMNKFTTYDYCWPKCSNKGAFIVTAYSLSRSQVVLEFIQAVPERQENSLDRSPVNHKTNTRTHTYHSLTHSHFHTQRKSSLQSSNENGQWEETGEKESMRRNRKLLSSDKCRPLCSYSCITPLEPLINLLDWLVVSSQFR